MNFILSVCQHLKEFGDHLFQDDAFSPGYAELLALLVVGALVYLVLTLFERRIDH